MTKVLDEQKENNPWTVELSKGFLFQLQEVLNNDFHSTKHLIRPTINMKSCLPGGGVRRPFIRKAKVPPYFESSHKFYMFQLCFCSFEGGGGSDSEAKRTLFF